MALEHHHLTWRERLADPAHPVWPIMRVLAVALLVKLGSSSFDTKEMMAIIGYAGTDSILTGLSRRARASG